MWKHKLVILGIVILVARIVYLTACNSRASNDISIPDNEVTGNMSEADNSNLATATITIKMRSEQSPGMYNR